jgi:pimeloyl-ACP methyl ester carboxylesterase
VSRRITEQKTTIAGIETFLRRTDGPGTPTVFVHGNPTHSAEWIPFMAELEGPAIALDLPNFGRSERVDPGRFDAGMHAYAAFLAAAFDELAPERFNLVVVDWGSIALHPAQRRPERVERLVIVDAVPLLAGYRWHWIARIWRRRGLGELFNALSSRAGLDLLLRLARPGYAAVPSDFVDMIWECWDRATARAVLRLYRSADPGALEAAGAHLGRLRCPALVAWGDSDPYIGLEFARRYAERLPNAELLELDRAGHWPWLDRPELIGRVCEFLDGSLTRP